MVEVALAYSTVEPPAAEGGMPQLACSTKLVLIQLHEGLLQCFSGAFMFWLQIMIGGLSVLGGLSDCRHFLDAEAS